MKVIQLMKNDFFFARLVVLVSFFSISLVSFFVLTLQDVFFDTQNYLNLFTAPNFFVVISGLSFNFVLFHWLALQIEKEEKKYYL